MSLIEICVDRSKMPMSLALMKTHASVAYGICDKHVKEHTSFDVFDGNNPFCFCCQQPFAKTALRFPTSRQIEYVNVEKRDQEEDLILGAVFSKSCMSTLNAEMLEIENEKNKFHAEMMKNPLIYVKEEETNDGKIIYKYYVLSHQERKENNDTRTTDQKRALMKKRQLLMEITTAEYPNLIAQHKQLQYELKALENKMRQANITIPSRITPDKAKALIVKLGIQSRRQVYAFVAFLFKNSDYRGNAHDMWKNLQEFKVEYEAIKFLFENKKYHVVCLANLESSLQTFMEEKLNHEDPAKTIWIHPHALKRKVNFIHNFVFVHFYENIRKCGATNA